MADEFEDAAIAAIEQKEPGLSEVKKRHTVKNFFSRDLLFATAKEGRKAVDRLACKEEDGQIRVFNDCEQFIEALAGESAPRTPETIIGDAASKNMRLLDKLADFVGNLRGWQLLLGVVMIASFGAVTLFLVGMGVLAAGTDGEDKRAIATWAGYALIICIGLFTAVCASCFGYDAWLKYRTKYEQVRVRVQNDFEKFLGLGEEEFNQLNILSVEFISLERKTREKIDAFHIDRPQNGASNLSNLHVYLTDTFSLGDPDKGGLIARWRLDEATQVNVKLTLMYKLLQKIAKILPAKAE